MFSKQKEKQPLLSKKNSTNQNNKSILENPNILKNIAQYLSVKEALTIAQVSKTTSTLNANPANGIRYQIKKETSEISTISYTQIQALLINTKKQEIDQIENSYFYRNKEVRKCISEGIFAPDGNIQCSSIATGGLTFCGGIAFWKVIIAMNTCASMGLSLGCGTVTGAATYGLCLFTHHTCYRKKESEVSVKKEELNNMMMYNRRNNEEGVPLLKMEL